mgnify:CR=1 FL=1
MYVKPEIIILFFLISFLIYTMPNVLVKFSNSCKGKLLLLVLTILIAHYNRIGGIIMVMFYIFLAEFNYEFNNEIIYEGFSSINEGECECESEGKCDCESKGEGEKLMIGLNNKDKLKVETELRPRESSLTTKV